MCLFNGCFGAWCRLGRVARKHGCPEACKRIIVEMYGFNAMEVQEAFIKICEQVSLSSNIAAYQPLVDQSRASIRVAIFHCIADTRCFWWMSVAMVEAQLSGFRL